MKMQFQILITETSDGVMLSLTDIEAKETTTIPLKESDYKALSVGWMAKFMLDKCKDIMRLTPEQVIERNTKSEWE